MKRKSPRIHTYILRMAAAFLVIVFISVFFTLGMYSPLSDAVTFTVKEGAAVSTVANALARGGIVDSAGAFKFVVRLHGGKIQRGQYDIPANASVWRVARMLARGDVASITVTIPEGLTIAQTKNLLQDVAALRGPVDCDDTADKGAPVCNLGDGDIFPDTYRVARGTSRLAVLELARKKMESIKTTWSENGKIAPHPLKTWNEIITLASIVQKETARNSEMPVVASVYLNRLRKNMKLQADPTVVYALTEGLGDMQGAPLLRGHLQIESPYNTYRNAGLPPGPIANVGQAAIRAVLKPADTNYLFFVADGRGGHKFANSYEEHQKNHADWRAIKKVRDAE